MGFAVGLADGMQQASLLNMLGAVICFVLGLGLVVQGYSQVRIECPAILRHGVRDFLAITTADIEEHYVASAGRLFHTS